MDFTLTREQLLLRDGLSEFLSTRYDPHKRRTAARTGAGWQPDIWRAFADELGILAAALPESAGGIGGGPVEVMVIAEELGRALVIEPFIDAVVVAGGLLARAGTERTTTVLEQAAAGEATVVLAATEAASTGWTTPATTAVRDGGGWLINGAKTVVVGAPLATHLLITARAGDRVALLFTEFDADAPPPGVQVHSYRTIDERRAADLVFDGLRLPADGLLDDDAAATLDRARDEGAAAICAEAVGAMRRVLDDTVAYCRQRHQFGQPIGSFQVLQHRMVDMYTELEQSVAASYLATLNLQSDPVSRARAVSAAKVTVGRAARFVGQNAVQLHGGMGMTEELAVGRYFARLTALQYEFGTTDEHRSRYAALTRPSGPGNLGSPGDVG